MIPHQEEALNHDIKEIDNSTLTNLVACDYFNVQKWDIRGNYTTNHENSFPLISVLEGEGLFNCVPIEKGHHFIIPLKR